MKPAESYLDKTCSAPPMKLVPSKKMKSIWQQQIEGEIEGILLPLLLVLAVFLTIQIKIS